ncbi:MAG: hypothetical protein V4801_12005 [Burkholderia gladioli]
MRALKHVHKVRSIAKTHARTAFVAAAGFAAGAGAHAQQTQGHGHAGGAAPTARYAAQYAAIQDRDRGYDPTAQSSPSTSPPPSSPDWHDYVDANRRVLAGQADLAAAMGLAGAAGQAAGAAGTLGADDGAAEHVSAAALTQIGGAQQSVAQALSQAFASAPQAGVDRDTFRTGLAALGEGLQRFEALPQGDGHAQALDATASRFAEHAPDQIDAATSTLHDAVHYAADHGIDVPPVATLALRRVTR